MHIAPLYQTKTGLPAPLEGPGVLHLRFALPLAQDKMLTYLQNSPWSYTQNERTVSIHMPDVDLTALVLPLTEVLSSIEQSEVRAIFQPDGRHMQLNDYFEIDSLKNFVARTLSGWLIDLMQNDHLKTVF